MAGGLRDEGARGGPARADDVWAVGRSRQGDDGRDGGPGWDGDSSPGSDVPERRAGWGGLLLGVGAALLVLVVVLAADGEHGPEAGAAAGRLADDLRVTAMNSYRPAINDVAIAAATSVDSPVVAVEEGDRRDVIGYLTFAVIAPDSRNHEGFFAAPDDWDPGPYCIRVPFSHWGIAGEFGTTEGFEPVRCPDEIVAADPGPPSYPVVPANAHEAVQEVLSSLDPAHPGDPAEIAAAVTALLDPVQDGATRAEPSVAVEDGLVGVAIGRDPTDCVLLALARGEVVDVHVPSVYLQPGELGCQGTTALHGDIPAPH